MFRLLLPTTAGKQQQIAILIISFFLYVDGIRNEGSNMLPLQQQQPIENSNYQSSSPSKTAFKASPLIEFTLDDVTIPHMTEDGDRPSFEDAKYPNNNLPSTPTATNERPNDNGNDNRRISTSYTNGEKQFSFSNEQQQQPTQYQQQQQQQQQHQFAQHLTETPIYIYKDPYTNENYHYTPTEPSYNRDVVLASSPATYNQQADNYNIQNYNSAPSGPQDNQEYLVHSSMIVGTQQQQQSDPFSLPPANKDVYLKRPGQVYDESYIPHPNAVIEKKSEVASTKKANKISYDSHDYPPPSYHQLQTSNFLPTPNPEGPARATPPPVIRDTPPPPLRATPPPPLASYSPSPNFFARPTSAPPAYVTPRPSYSDEYRPKPPSSPFGQQYLQSSQNVLPNYVNNLDNYLSNKQQTQYYRPEQAAGPPPPSSQYPQYEETIPPPYRQPPQQQQQYQQSSYPPFEQQHQQRPQYPSYQTSQYPSNGPPSLSQSQPPFSSRPSYNNYYDYQIGEVPPQTQGAFNYPYPRPPPPPQSNGPYRPPYVPPPTTQQPSGLATLVQYAPQFTSLLLGGGGGSSSSTNSPLGSLLGVLTGAGNNPQSSSSSSPSSSSSLLNRRPINSQLIKALENIARNDDLQCVPKVLCQMIASQTQRGQLPSFITSPAITNFLAAFPASSPALIYGRAALLGISGGDRSCHQTYVKCPKNEIEIINYLNNYRGGFFKFFSEPDDQTLNQQNGNHDSFQSGGATSLFSILSALTGTPTQPQVTTPRPRPKPQPTAASSDITETIGNFFTNLLSDYMGGGAVVEYQRRSARRKRSMAEKRVRFEEDDDDEKFNFDEDYNDEEDTDDTEKNVEFQYEPEEENGEKSGSESRVIHRLTLPKEKRLKFFPDSDDKTDGSGNHYNDEEEHLRKIIEKFNEFNKGRKLKFPADTSEREYIDVAAEYLRGGKQLDYNSKGQDEQQQVNYGHQYNNYEQENYVKEEDSKKIKFYDDPEEKMSTSDHSKELRDLRVAESHHTGKKIRFPEREPKILNRPNYAASFSYQQQQKQPTPPEYEENEDHQRPNYYKELEEEQQAHLYNNQADYGESSNPYDYNQYQAPSRPQNYYGYHQGLPPSSVGIYNTHLTSLNSVNNYVSNTATNLNYFVTTQSPSNSGGSANYFLPTPAPDTADEDNNYDNNLYNNDNKLATNQKDYNSNYDSNNNNYYYNKYHKFTNSNSHKYNRYQSYTTTNSNNLNSQTYNSNRYRPAYNRPQSDVSNTNNNSNNVYNRYHSSLYQRRTTTTTTTTTPRPNDNNIYVTNARGETEYYIRPDGRKVYL